MLSFAAAHKTMLAHVRPLPTEEVPLDECAGRVLMTDISSDIDMPPFDKSAMDGYACRRADLPGPLRVLGSIPAGCVTDLVLEPGTCVEIMTGAPLPHEADCVVMVEHVRTDGDTIVRVQASGADNICRRAEDIATGQVVLRTGTLLGPAEVAVLAGAGATRVPVARRVRVGVLATGSELVTIDQLPSGAHIRDSNSHQLIAQLQTLGADAWRLGIVADEREMILAALATARRECDLVICSGGVSMGNLDLVPELLEASGFDLCFDSVAMQPGRPTVFGDTGDCYCCGLPGNPVSTFVVTELLLRPFIYALAGHAWYPRWHRSVLAVDVERRNARRQSALPVVWRDPLHVEPVAYHGSAHIHAYTAAQGLLILPIGTARLSAGSEIDVRSL